MEKKYPSRLSKQDIIDQLVQNNALLQQKSVDLLNSMNNLTKKIENLVDIFQKAAEHIEMEEVKQPLAGKLTELLEQNKKIAQGLVLLEKFVREKGALPLRSKEFEL